MTLTEKQTAWDAAKKAQREERRRPMTIDLRLARNVHRTGSFYHDPRRARGVRTPVRPSGRPRGQCSACPHGWKHHTATGHCRPGCPCTNGAERARD